MVRIRCLLTGPQGCAADLDGSLVEGWHNIIVSPEDSRGPDFGRVPTPEDPSPAALGRTAAPAVAASSAATRFDARELEGLPTVVQRYFRKDADATDADGWFDTGDIATIDANGDVAEARYRARVDVLFDTSAHIVGGAPMGEQLMERIESQLGAIVQTSWGMTELTPLGAIAPAGLARREAASAGRGAIGLDLLLKDGTAFTLLDLRPSTPFYRNDVPATPPG